MYMESHHFSAVLFYTSLWNGMGGTRAVGQLGFVSAEETGSFQSLSLHRRALGGPTPSARQRGQVELIGEH